MTPEITEHDRDVYLGLAATADVEAATDFAFDLIDRGVDFSAVVRDLLVPAQLEVGRRWETNEWNVAQEHAATAVTDAVLATVASAITPVRSGDEHLVVACAEGEYHTMPVRMATELLKAAGWKVTFVGPSSPAHHLGEFIAQVKPTAAAIACSVPIFLAGARRSIDAAHVAGVPAYAAGRAFGSDAHRAKRLGADGWFASHTELIEWERDDPPPMPREHVALEAARAGIVEDAFEELAERIPAVREYTAEQVARSCEDLDYTLQFLSSALLVDDESVFDDYVDWAANVLEARGVPRPVLAMSLTCLDEVLPAGTETARSLLQNAAARVS